MDRPTDARSFRGAYRAVAASVAVILTAQDGGGIRGITCTSAISLSATPPLALACVDARTGFRELVSASASFSVNYLAAGYAHVASAFARSGEDLSHLTHATVAGRTGVPTLAFGTVSVVECTLHDDIRAGDHWILVGHIGHSRYQFDARPLVYSQGRYTEVSLPMMSTGGAP